MWGNRAYQVGPIKTILELNIGDYYLNSDRGAWCCKDNNPYDDDKTVTYHEIFIIMRGYERRNK